MWGPTGALLVVVKVMLLVADTLGAEPVVSSLELRVRKNFVGTPNLHELFLCLG